MGRSMTKILKWVLVVSLVAGCGFTEGKEEAEQLAGRLFDSVRSHDFDTAMTYYSEAFFNQTSQDEWTTVLNSLNQKLGDLQSYELNGWNVKKQVHTSGSGTFVSLQYHVTYARYPATEVLVLFKPVGGDYKVLSHNINSKGLLVD